jgi:hypothetical protein
VNFRNFGKIIPDSQHQFVLRKQLTRGPHQFKAYNSAPILQYGSKISSDFLAKTSSVNTQTVSLLIHNFILQYLHFLLVSVVRTRSDMLSAAAQLEAYGLPMVQAACAHVLPISLFLFLAHVYNGFQD